MANISISDLHPSGSELFVDSENYMSELTDNNLTKPNSLFFVPTILGMPGYISEPILVLKELQHFFIRIFKLNLLLNLTR